MTPKELLEKHGGDPLAAADALAGEVEYINWPNEQILEAFGSWLAGFACLRETVDLIIAHLGEDGAEKCGKALAAIVVPNTLMLPVPVSAPNRLEPILSFTQVTRIANATDRERLAACIVALAEGLQRNTI